MALSLVPTNPSWLHLSSSSCSRPSVVLPRRFIGISSSTHRHRMLVVRATQASGGDGADPSQGDIKVTNSSTGLHIPNIPAWARWLLAPIILVALPFYKKFLKMEDELEQTAETVVDVVQAVADATEKMSSEMADALPDDGKLEQLVLKVGDFAEAVGDQADLAEDMIEMVDAFVDKVEDMLEPVIEEGLSGEK
ncbi:uncharacterized protein [Elaeis guineensis]|uniref:Uncharacterized protein LOC105041426 n=1 Tax=Elaeis guineensis var. tenera TaxID=51953 RepID=A0A6I9QYT7_ELAGV|nr:uncharacterized protein LOC105041426 [Elaeis guineensis]